MQRIPTVVILATDNDVRVFDEAIAPIQHILPKSFRKDVVSCIIENIQDADNGYGNICDYVYDVIEEMDAPNPEQTRILNKAITDLGEAVITQVCSLRMYSEERMLWWYCAEMLGRDAVLRRISDDDIDYE